MSIPITIVAAAQLRVVRQRLRYRGGVPRAYLCPTCRAWHDHAAPKLYDHAAGTYHGVACRDDELAAAREATRLAKWRASMARRTAA